MRKNVLLCQLLDFAPLREINGKVYPQNKAFIQLNTRRPSQQRGNAPDALTFTCQLLDDNACSGMQQSSC